MSYVVPTAVGAYRAYKRTRAMYNAAHAAAGPTLRSMLKGGTGGGRRKVRGSRTKFAKAVRKVILSTAEKCYKSRQVDGQSFNHDSLGGVVIWNPSTTSIWPSQGNGDGERRGDEIYATGIMMRAVFQIPQDRRNTKFKMWYVAYDDQNTGGINKSTFFHNVSNNVMVDPVQTDRWRGVKYLGIYKCSASDQTTGSQDKTIIMKKWIPLKRKVNFQTDSSSLPIGVPPIGAIMIAPYDTITSVTTDTLITNSEITFTLYFKPEEQK